HSGRRGCRPPRLAGGRAAGLAGHPPLPAAGTQPFWAVVLDSVLGASPFLGARALCVLCAPLILQLTSGVAAAPPPALRAWPGPARLQCRVEEEPSGCASLPRPGRVLAGHSANSRIVWEHTRGRYTCTQCPYSTASRDEMTLHIEEHRKNPPPPARLDGDVDFAVGIPSFHTKLTPEMENSLYSQL
ncbi:ZN414 protein, partial [Nothoprocta ornata]|nr:ZN414 protein [Nothoprocta pentlandii]NWY06666.1 ZN414 protein [Nothoprocta ornata]